MLKKMLAVLLITIALCTSNSTNTFANEPGGITITPFWNYTMSTHAVLSISSSGSANAYAHMISNPNEIDKTNISMTLYKQNSVGSWQSVKSWSESNNSYIMSLDKYHNVSAGYYKLVVDFKSYSGSTLKETVSTTVYRSY